MAKQFDIGDKSWFGNIIINQFQGTDLTAIDPEERARMLAEGLLQSMSEVVMHPEMQAHIRDVVSNELKEAQPDQPSDDRVSIGQRIWREAEPGVTGAFTTLVTESQKTSERVLREVGTDYEHESVKLDAGERKTFELHLKMGDSVMFRPRLPATNFHIEVVSPDGTRLSRAGPQDVGDVPKMFRADQDGCYYLKLVLEGRYSARCEFEYRITGRPGLQVVDKVVG